MTDEPYKMLAIEERLAQVERELGLVPTSGNPLAQGLTAKLRGQVGPLVDSIAELRQSLERLESRTDGVVGVLHQLRRSAFKRKP